MKTEEQTNKEKQQARAKARADRAIAAAEAILLPLGFTRNIPAKQDAAFNEWGPGQWFLDSPRMRAALRLQSKPFLSQDSDPLTYRLELSADSSFGVRSPRVAPGNGKAVEDYIAKVNAARAEQAKREQGFSKLASRAEELFLHDYPNLKVVDVEAYQDQINVKAKTSSGVPLTIILNGRFRLVSILVGGEDENKTAALDKLSAALKAL